MRLKDIFFPSGIRCVFCRSEVGDLNICPTCYESLPWIVGRTCLKCGGRVLGNETICIECRSNNDLDYDRCYSVFDYDDKVRGSILSFKSSGKRNIGRAFARVLLEYLDSLGLDFDYIIPMPIHPSRERDRGFNQCHILTEEIEGRYPVEKGVIRRVIDTPHQTGLSRDNRKNNLRGAFEVVDKSKVEGKVIVVIDDVYTTGSTMSEIARTLKSKGANAVIGLCLARGLVYNR